jgi:hypothetical protein
VKVPYYENVMKTLQKLSNSLFPTLVPKSTLKIVLYEVYIEDRLTDITFYRSSASGIYSIDFLKYWTLSLLFLQKGWSLLITGR